MKIIIATIAACLLIGGAVSAQEQTAYSIIKNSNDKEDDAKTASYTAVMTLTSKSGGVRTRIVSSRSKNFGTIKKTVIVFSTPKDVAGVAYLTWEYDKDADSSKKDDDSWLYMPALKKARRISGSSKGDDFMGTDFTYDDIGSRNIDKDEYTLIGKETVSGTLCWVIECTAKDKTQKNPKRVVWIAEDNYSLIKTDYYDRQNNVQRTLTCSDIAKIDGIWTTQTMYMKNMQRGTATKIEMKNVEYNQPVQDSLFTVSSLERGNVK